MDPRQLAAAVVLFGLACDPQAFDDAFSYESNIGLVLRTGDRHCLSIRNPALQNGDRLMIVEVLPVAGRIRPRVLGAQVAGRGEPCEPGVTGAAVVAFEVSVPDAVGSIQLAVLAPAPAFVVQDGRVRADLDGDGTDESFRACTSAEGVHLTVWSGEPLEGTRRWHQYYPLGYDVEPTCEPADYGE